MSVALGALAGVYGWGARVRVAAYHWGWLRQRRLQHPVVSVGNLTAGGTGKTPLVRWTVDRMIGRGLRPAILIRGYRRKEGPDAVVIPPKAGRAPLAREVGDEAAWLARVFPEVPIGVSADRFRTGQLIEENYPVDIFVLDDGFQHLALARELDIVAVDATRGISDSELLPVGLQREPCSAIERADLVVITRTELADSGPVERTIESIHPRAWVMRARTRVDELIVAGTGEVLRVETLIGRPVHAFCGIGNPDAFFRNLRLWGFDVIRESVFPDHHAYRDLRFAQGGGVAAVLTTEKDFMNLEGLDLAAMPVPLAACVTRTEVDEPAAFDNLLSARLGRSEPLAGAAS